MIPNTRVPSRYLYFAVICFFSFHSPSINSQSVAKAQGTKTKIPLNLDRAILIGTTNNVLLRTIESKKEITKLVITEKWREFLPKVGVQYMGLRNTNVGSIDNLYNDVRLTVQQLVFDGGEASLQVEIARLGEALNEQDFKVGAVKLKLDIQKAYLKTLSAKGKILLGQKVVEKMNESLRKAKAEFGQGLISRIQYSEVTNKVKQSQLTLLKYKNEYNQTALELKQVLSLDFHVELDLEENLFTDFVLSIPQIDSEEAVIRAMNTREDLKKSQLVIKRLKNEKKIADNYWVPKVYLGGYAGKNGNDFPLKHDIYGLNFNFVLPLGSTVVQSNGNLGVQKDGTGIQTYPGFGNQTVGPGINGYESSRIQFFDNLSYSRKIMEGEVQLSEALMNYKNLENQIGIEVQKSVDRVNESWEMMKISNSGVILNWETLRVGNVKLGAGQFRKEDVLSSELEFLKSQQELTDSLANYMISLYEMSFAANIDLSVKKLIQYEKGKGNSVIAALLFDRDPRKAIGVDAPGE
ncbi:TolC family protein [Leptospira semungkisensis]|nr:TolC family protein [Leptospira semungkisensis]